MKKLAALLNALLITVLCTVPAFADIVVSPVERFLFSPWLFVILAVLLVGVAVALFFIIRAVVRKKKGK